MKMHVSEPVLHTNYVVSSFTKLCSLNWVRSAQCGHIRFSFTYAVKSSYFYPNLEPCLMFSQGELFLKTS
jgi:hypothetical protein